MRVKDRIMSRLLSLRKSRDNVEHAIFDVHYISLLFDCCPPSC